MDQFVYDGESREYYFYLPDSTEEQAPLVFVFHGYTGTANGIMDYSGFNQIADLNGFAVCYPQGLLDEDGNSFFNVGYSFHWDQTVDDVGFIISLANFLQEEYNLSKINTFTTGMSNGGDLSYLLACDASDIFRAAAPVAGIMMSWIYESCDPIKPMPMLEIHGTNDNISWWDGDPNDSGGWGPYIGVDPAVQLWVEFNNCTSTFIDTLPNINTSDGTFVISEKYTDCINNNEVWLYKVINGGHDWPGSSGGNQVNDLIASNLVWEFFDQSSLIYQIGDLNYSSTVDIFDLLMIADEIHLNQSFNFLSDLNRDNSIDSNDIYLILITILDF